jgi:hypothetical protein
MEMEQYTSTCEEDRKWRRRGNPRCGEWDIYRKRRGCTLRANYMPSLLGTSVGLPRIVSSMGRRLLHFTKKGEFRLWAISRGTKSWFIWARPSQSIQLGHLVAFVVPIRTSSLQDISGEKIATKVSNSSRLHISRCYVVDRAMHWTPMLTVTNLPKFTVDLVDII